MPPPTTDICVHTRKTRPLSFAARHSSALQEIVRIEGPRHTTEGLCDRLSAYILPSWTRVQSSRMIMLVMDTNKDVSMTMRTQNRTCKAVPCDSL